LTLNDFLLFPEIKSVLKGLRCQDTEDIQKKKKKKIDGTESFYTTGVPKMFQAVAASLG
jgi:hypothetical protein